MLFEQKIQPISFHNGALRFDFLPTGETFQFLGGPVLINQLLGNTLDGSANNIFLRCYRNDSIEFVPLMGKKSTSTFAVSEQTATWSGSAFDLDYTLTFALGSDSTWFWSLDLNGNDSVVDVLFAQDISVADKGATITNELYMSQYLDHKIIETDLGYVVCSRQNQGNIHPYVQHGSINTKLVGFATDAMQFYGIDYKGTHEAIALRQDLPNENYQFEQSMISLQTEKITVNGTQNITFYGLFKANHAMAVQTLDYQNEIASAYETFTANQAAVTIAQPAITLKSHFGAPFVSEPFTHDELKTFFPTQNLSEVIDGQIMSFFTPTHEHVVLQAKELIVERPHGHIITTGVNTTEIQTDLLTSTSYMYGVFNAQVVCSNTSMNKLLSVPRGLLNVFKNSGQRLYVKIADQFQLLTLPAAYEIGVNHAKWFYKINDDILTVTSFASKDCADITLDVTSTNGITYEFIITNQLVMGSNEFEQASLVTELPGGVSIRPLADAFIAQTYPELQYNMFIDGTTFTISDDAIFYTDEVSRFGTLLTFSTNATSQFSLTMQGRIVAHEPTLTLHDFATEKAKFHAMYVDLTCGFNLSTPEQRDDITKANEIFWWYTHNAMTHYAVPHGLEQPGGAAWGTRDVCQGPMEYFLMTQHFPLARKILCEIFAHQFLETGEWPQWFMFDRYNMQQDESHGDVVFWPLKALGDYIRITGDDSILSEMVVYRHFPHNEISQPETIIAHVKRAIASISKRFLYDTALISYDGGDWDDTLQPANKDLQEKLVSSWTVALAYQSIGQLGTLIANVDANLATTLVEMAEKIKVSFNELLIKDGVIAGFAYCEDADSIEYMLHPDDQKTGINYRLLPMTRSIISELVSKEQADENVALIDQHLTFPDGVRLMNRPATYNGGDIKFFQRAEQASNVGREIGLNYVHAHIRFIEAMAKYGDASKAWQGLETINPINITKVVPNALTRQSNAYFSSSEGAFTSRYDFQDNFDKLRTGDIAVKGGWRIYSSGPGIYLNQLVSNVLGFRLNAHTLEIDPMLPADLSGLTFNYQYEHKPVQLVYTLTDTAQPIRAINVNGTDIPFTIGANPYRHGAAIIDKMTLNAHLNDTNNIITITR